MSRSPPPSTRTTSWPGVAGVLKRPSSFEHPALAPKAINSNAPQRHHATVVAWYAGGASIGVTRTRTSQGYEAPARNRSNFEDDHKPGGSQYGPSLTTAESPAMTR